MADIRITPAASIMAFTSSLNFKETLTQDASGSLTLYGSGSTGRTDIFSVDGNNGRLFSVSDDLSNSLFSVNTIAGLPVIEAFADNTVVMGQYGQNILVVTGSNVGIGTASPLAKLQISSGNNNDTQLLIGQSSTYGAPSIRFKTSSTNYMGLGFITGSAVGNEVLDALVIQRTGNVGIGVTNPGSKLEIAGALGGTVGIGGSTIRLVNTDTGDKASITSGITGVTNDGMQLSVNGTARMVIGGTGNIGIGTTTPDVKLHVVSQAFIGDDAVSQGLTLEGGPNSSINFRASSAQTAQITCGDTSNLFLDAFDSRAIELALDGTTVLEVSNTANVGIGTLGSVDPSALLEVKSTTQGFLPPRMDEGERNSIPSPAFGLMIYNTSTDEVNVFSGGTWKRVGYV
jgi:hypothetical protein